MMRAPVQLFDSVPEVLAELSASHELMMITKGDLIDQERKLTRSGLAAYFSSVEIVVDKTAQVYRSLLAKYDIAPQRFLMVGNSLRSDILPVVELGGYAVHIPYHVTWAHEAVAVSDDGPKGYVELNRIGMLPAHLDRLSRLREKD
jgi:putative hydrolase of the HAD superfamily